MRQTFTLAVGATLRGASLPDGSPAAAVRIDNPSGNWLTVYPLAMTCPPYTQGWIADVGGSIVDVLPLAGPAGQVASAAGSPVVVTLFDDAEAPDPSDGSALIEGFTPLSVATFTHDYGTGGTSFQSNTAVTGGTKRMRVQSVQLAVPGTINGSIPAWGIAGGATYAGGSQQPVAALTIGGTKVRDQLVFSPYLDLPIGQELTLYLVAGDIGSTLWAGHSLAVLATAPIVSVFYLLV